MLNDHHCHCPLLIDFSMNKLQHLHIIIKIHTCTYKLETNQPQQAAPNFFNGEVEDTQKLGFMLWLNICSLDPIISNKQLLPIFNSPRTDLDEASSSCPRLRMQRAPPKCRLDSSHSASSVEPYAAMEHLGLQTPSIHPANPLCFC